MSQKWLVTFGIAFSLAAAQKDSDNVQTMGSESRILTGTLIDFKKSNCGPEVERAVAAGTCPASVRTTDFGLALPGGKTVKFDEAGNSKVTDALRRSKKGSKAVIDYWRTGKATASVTARVTGTLTSDTFNVESVRID